AESGGDLLGDAGAADQAAALQDADPEAGAGEEPRGHQTVVPAADDDDVERVGGARARHSQAMIGSSLYIDRRSCPLAKRSKDRGVMSRLGVPFNISSAMRRPVAGASLKPCPEQPLQRISPSTPDAVPITGR